MSKINDFFRKIKFRIKNGLDGFRYFMRGKWESLKSILPNYEMRQLKNETMNDFSQYIARIKQSLMITSMTRKQFALKITKIIILSISTVFLYLCFKLGMRNRFYDDRNGVNRSKTEIFFRFLLFIFLFNVFYLVYFIGYNITRLRH